MLRRRLGPVADRHPCLPWGQPHRDADGTLWVGCGTNAVGYGLFVSENGGATWLAAPVDTERLLEEFRVSSISRGHDDALYVAGFDAGSRNMVLRLDTKETPFATTVALVGVNVVGRSFHVGSYRELSDGRAIAESLNGVPLLYRPSPAVGNSAADWTRYQELPVQILDLAVDRDVFYGAGGAINRAPHLFLPPRTVGADPFEFEVVALPTGWEGELYGIAVNSRRLVAVGVNQDWGVGKIMVSGPDIYDASGYSEISLHTIIGLGGAGTWLRGVCMRDDHIVAVGERYPLSGNSGRVVQSFDGGASFTYVTPDYGATTISKCIIEPDGTVVVAGSANFIGILPPAREPAIFSHGFEPL